MKKRRKQNPINKYLNVQMKLTAPTHFLKQPMHTTTLCACVFICLITNKCSQTVYS